MVRLTLLFLQRQHISWTMTWKLRSLVWEMVTLRFIRWTIISSALRDCLNSGLICRKGGRWLIGCAFNTAWKRDNRLFASYTGIWARDHAGGYVCPMEEPLKKSRLIWQSIGTAYRCRNNVFSGPSASTEGWLFLPLYDIFTGVGVCALQRRMPTDECRCCV